MERLRNIFNAFTNTPNPAEKNCIIIKSESKLETHAIHLFETSDCFYFRSQDLSKVKEGNK